jgi:hypothetical protein
MGIYYWSQAEAEAEAAPSASGLPGSDFGECRWVRRPPNESDLRLVLPVADEMASSRAGGAHPKPNDPFHAMLHFIYYI